MVGEMKSQMLRDLKPSDALARDRRWFKMEMQHLWKDRERSALALTIGAPPERSEDRPSERSEPEDGPPERPGDARDLKMLVLNCL